MEMFRCGIQGLWSSDRTLNALVSSDVCHPLRVLAADGSEMPFRHVICLSLFTERRFIRQIHCPRARLTD